VLLGMAAYILKSPLHRLLVVSFANMALSIDWAVGWSGMSRDTTSTRTSFSELLPHCATLLRLTDPLSVFAAGFILANLSKLANHGNNPVWPIVDHRSGGWNKTGLAFALLSLVQFAARPPAMGASTSVPKTQYTTKQVDRSSLWRASAGLGGTLFALHSLFADSGTIVAWSWTGYPAKVGAKV
jgi:hypothetical protein